MSILCAVFTPVERRRRYGRWAVIGLYLVVALVTPMLHHDVACHLQSKSHCDACASQATASGVESIVALIGHAGGVVLCVPGEINARAFAERPSSPGRAPPPSSSSL